MPGSVYQGSCNIPGNLDPKFGSRNVKVCKGQTRGKKIKLNSIILPTAVTTMVKCNVKMLQILRKIFLQKNILSWQPFFFWKQIAKTHHNCLQYESVLKIWYFHIFEYLQIWLKFFWTIITWATSQNCKRQKKNCHKFANVLGILHSSGDLHDEHTV
jgi:hypothetical protein